MARIVAQIVEIGPLFAGDTGPTIDFILLWDTGGFVDLTGASPITANIRRWDARRKVPVGPVITSGVCTLGVATAGECTFAWTSATPVSSVPVDPGWYIANVVVTFASTIMQNSQRVIFEVLPT